MEEKEDKIGRERSLYKLNSIKLWCPNCRTKTEHTIHGFEYSNRRNRCLICNLELWDGKTEMEAPLE